MLTSKQSEVLSALKRALRDEAGEPVTDLLVHGSLYVASPLRPGDVRRVLAALVKRGEILKVNDGQIDRYTIQKGDK